MPRGNNLPAESKLIKMLLIGPAMVGKSHYAMQAALGGFNIFYLDGDVAGRALAGQPNAIKERIFYMDARDTMDEGVYTARFNSLFDTLTTTPVLYWNDSKQKSVRVAPPEEDDAVWAIRLSRLGPRDVLVIDSLTSLSNSVMRAIGEAAGVDLTDIERAERGIYASARNRMSGFMTMIRAARCHVILIAHADEWEKRRRNPGKVKEMSKEDNMIVVGTRSVPMTVSKPFGAAIAKDFTDCGWMTITSMGKREIDFTPQADREGGGALNIKGEADGACSFVSLCKLIGVELPGPANPFSSPGVEELTAAELSARLASSPAVLQPSATPTQAKVAKPSGFTFAGMAGKQGGAA